MIGWRWAGVAVVLLGAGSVYALGESPVLHEYLPPDLQEDLLVGARSAGDIPAALETPSGLVGDPDEGAHPPGGSDKVYDSQRGISDTLFYPDRDTRRPLGTVFYDDPFAPSTAPFKRLFVYDKVYSDETLGVAQSALHNLSLGGAPVQAGEEAFYENLTVELAAGEAIRIPSVAAGARVVRLHATPEASVEVLADGAENWFVRGSSRERTRLVLELAAPHGAFGGTLADARWGALLSAPPLPKTTQQSADTVNRRIGVSRAISFREAVTKLVDYYRSFEETAAPLSSGGDIFLELALSRKGVCRHRAFAFTVSALGLGIPTRLVVNEAHAWVEVHDGSLWHRIDLGGAAMEIDTSQNPQTVAHAPPPDPFAWPAQANSAEQAMRVARQKALLNDGPQSATADASGASPHVSAADSSSAGVLQGALQDVATQGPSSQTGPIQNRGEGPHVTVLIETADQQVFRNQPLHVQGKVEGSGSPCAHSRVDILLVSKQREAPLGTLATDEQGHFEGAVLVPSTINVGDYDIVAATPGDAQCGSGRSEDSGNHE